MLYFTLLTNPTPHIQTFSSYQYGLRSSPHTRSSTVNRTKPFPPFVLQSRAQIEAGINICLGIQRRAVTFGKRPFAACLLGPDNETVLLTHQSIDQVNHAEVHQSPSTVPTYPSFSLLKGRAPSPAKPIRTTRKPTIGNAPSSLPGSLAPCVLLLLGKHRSCCICCYE